MSSAMGERASTDVGAARSPFVAGDVERMAYSTVEWKRSGRRERNKRIKGLTPNVRTRAGLSKRGSIEEDGERRG
jgi:hypothetical protein